ncbi:MAG: CotH kinase family protein [bacterium]|nr:CotH kinase family protein [bacterium]
MKGPSLLFLFFFLLTPKSPAQTNFYDITRIQKIEIFFQEQNWDHILDTTKYGTDKFTMAKWVKINGLYFDSVGVKYKGNSSYDSTYLKNPFHIELNTFKNQALDGLTDIKLSNGYADPSFMREVLSYEILRNYIPASQSNFAQVYINGSYIGLYSNSESVDKAFCANHFYSADGVFVKCNPKLTPSPNVKSNLKSLPGDSSAYLNYYEMKSNYGWNHLQALCDSISNKPNDIAGSIDVDKTLWMLAFNVLTVNLDSYNGAFAQNYYLYRDGTRRFNPILWDLNMSFGGFPFLGNSNTSLGALSISGMQTLPSNIHATDPYWPLIKTVMGNPLYKNMYAAHLKTITNEYFANNLYTNRCNFFKTLIDTAVVADTKKFYSYAQFQNSLTSNISVGSYSVPGIQTLMNARVSYLQTTPEFTNLSPTITAIGAGIPIPKQAVTVTASISGATNSYLSYRFTGSATFTRLNMYDDGLHQDGAANDAIYGATFVLEGNHAHYYLYAENTNAGIFSPVRAEHEFYSLDVLPHPVPGQVVINEFLAFNKSDVKNEFHASEDWIELLNTSSIPLSLDGYYLSDNPAVKAKFVFPPGTAIAAHDFVMVWADNFTKGSQLHTDFKLDENGDHLIFSNGLTTILDNISFGSQEVDVSMARCPDGTGNFTPTKLPSYKAFNCAVGLTELDPLQNMLSLYPNPCTALVNVSCTSCDATELKIFSLLGTPVFKSEFIDHMTVNTNPFENGLYLVTLGNHALKLLIHH